MLKARTGGASARRMVEKRTSVESAHRADRACSCSRLCVCMLGSAQTVPRPVLPACRYTSGCAAALPAPAVALPVPRRIRLLCSDALPDGREVRSRLGRSWFCLPDARSGAHRSAASQDNDRHLRNMAALHCCSIRTGSYLTQYCSVGTALANSTRYAGAHRRCTLRGRRLHRHSDGGATCPLMGKPPKRAGPRCNILQADVDGPRTDVDPGRICGAASCGLHNSEDKSTGADGVACHCSDLPPRLARCRDIGTDAKPHHRPHYAETFPLIV